MNTRLPVVTLLLVALGASACETKEVPKADQPKASDESKKAAAPEAKKTPTIVRVLAASSLKESFEDLERAFEKAKPEVDVQLVLAGSQVLRLQIEQGAKADIFASANPEHIDTLVKARLIQASQTFAHNELVLIVPKAEKSPLGSFQDLDKASRIVLGGDEVPVGVYSSQVLERAGSEWGKPWLEAVRSHVVSKESNVRLVRTKVEMAEADAAIVYRTDAMASDKVRTLDIPESLNVRAAYPIGVLTSAPQPKAAQAFVEYVISDKGQAALEARGFTRAGQITQADQ